MWARTVVLSNIWISAALRLHATSAWKKRRKGGGSQRLREPLAYGIPLAELRQQRLPGDVVHAEKVQRAGPLAHLRQHGQPRRFWHLVQTNGLPGRCSRR